MSYKNVASAGDLVRFVRAMLGRAPHVLRVPLLKVECTHCGAARTLNGVDVYQVHGNQQLSQLAPRLKCRRCRKKAARLAVLGPVYPD